MESIHKYTNTKKDSNEIRPQQRNQTKKKGFPVNFFFYKYKHKCTNENTHKYANTQIQKDLNGIRPQQGNQTKKCFPVNFFYKYKHKCTNENTHKYANTEIQKDLNGIRPQQGNQTKKCFPINFLRDSDGSRRCPQNPGT